MTASPGTNMYNQSDLNSNVWVKFTNENGFADDCELRGTSTLPTTTGLFSKGCSIKIEDTGAEYFNTAADGLAPTWVAASVPANASVTLAKLAAGIAPSHVIKFGGQLTTVGGAAAEAFTISGLVAATDRAFIQMVDNGTSNVTVLQAVVTTNTLTVTFSADPGADTIFNYQIIRAAA